MYHTNNKDKKTDRAILLTDKEDFKAKKKGVKFR